MTAAQKQFDKSRRGRNLQLAWEGTKFERDHAIKVQHVIKMLVEIAYLDDVRCPKATLTSVCHLD